MKQDNPYYYTLPAEPANFVGRWAIVDDIVADLVRPRCDSWAVIGGRRFGKSSLLKAIEARLLAHLSTRQRGARHVVPVVVDLKRCGIETEEHIYACIVRELYRTLRRKRLPGIELTQLELPERSKARMISFADFEDMLEGLDQLVEDQLGPLRLVLLLDEVDAMVHHQWSETLFNQLRALVHDGFLAKTVKVVLAGSTGFIKTQEGSPLWNVLKPVYLRSLSADDLTELIAKGGSIATDVFAAIQEQSGGHPFIVQYLLHYLWNDQDTLSQATLVQVLQVAQQMHQERFDDLQGWWEAIGEGGRRAYALLANAPGEVEDRMLLTHLLDKSLPLDRALRSLRYHGLAARSENRQKYHIAGTLFRNWYLRNVLHRQEDEERTIPTYQTLDLLITAASPGQLRVQVLPSAAGGDATEFVAQPAYQTAQIETGAVINLQQMGDEIGNALFSGRVSQRFAERLHILHEQHTGVRIRLHIDDESIAQIPWEAARFNDEYLSLRLRTPLVRYVPTDDPPPALMVTSALRVLGIVSSPLDLISLNVAQEQQAFEQALQPLIDAGKVYLTWLPQADKQLLQEKIRQWKPHIIHFVGHGDYDESRREGDLFFTNAVGQAVRASASELAIHLRDSEVRFVLLNACNSGRTSGGLAETLVRKGIPAALGIQTEVRDDVAIAFATSFYRALSDGWPVDAALVEGRKAIVNLIGLERPDWVQPVLYMRAPDGQLFRTATADSG